MVHTVTVPRHGLDDPSLYVAQFIVYSIDNIKCSLSPYKDFSNYVKRECSDIGLRGFVWKISHVHGRILALGTRYQHDMLLSFIRRLESFGFVTSFEPEKPKQGLVAAIPEAFDIRFDARKGRVAREDYRARSVDDLSLTSDNSLGEHDTS